MNAEADAPMQTVRVPKDVLEALKPVAKSAGRSVPKEIEHRLRQSLVAPEAGATGQASDWATALGLLVTRLAHRTALESQSADEALATMEASAPALLSGLLDGFRSALKAEVHELTKSERLAAQEAGQALAERVKAAGAPRPRPRGDTIEDKWAELAAKHAEAESLFDQKELLEIQAKLLLSPELLKQMKAGGKR